MPRERTPRPAAPPPELRRRALRIVRRLAQAYPDAHCALHYHDPFELLVATILSAQCTDKKVNEVTPALFARYGSPAALADAAPAAVERMIRPTGFYRQKTRSLQSAARDIVARFGGRVPDTMEDLTSLHGVARKTANVVLGNAFGVPGLTVDTHMTRVTQRLELTEHDDPVKIERDLMELVPRDEWTMFSHRVIQHGRECCAARSPRCDGCPIRPDCPWPGKHAHESGAARPARRSTAARPAARVESSARRAGHAPRRSARR
jgi:endonuclease-3